MSTDQVERALSVSVATLIDFSEFLETVLLFPIHAVNRIYKRMHMSLIGVC